MLVQRGEGARGEDEVRARRPKQPYQSTQMFLSLRQIGYGIAGKCASWLPGADETDRVREVMRTTPAPFRAAANDRGGIRQKLCAVFESAVGAPGQVATEA